MKKTILIPTLILLFGMGFTVSASAANYTCADLTWSAQRLELNSDIANVCLEVVEKNGGTFAKLRARVVRQGVNSTVVQYQRPDGTWSPSQRVFPEGFEALIAGKEVRISDLAPRQELNVYINGENNFTLPAPVVAAAPPPPPPAPEPEPEPEPVALPTTATQLPLFALLGGLLLLMGGLVSVVRTRL